MISLQRGHLKSSKVFFLLTLLLGSHAFAEGPVDLSGSFRAAAWEKDKSFEDKRNVSTGALWLKVLPQEISGWKAYLEGFVQNQDAGRSGYAEGDLREAFIEKSWEFVDVKVGRQLIVWGRADKVNPTDSFSTKDLKFLSSDDEDQRRGQFATQINWHLGSTKVTGVWQSEWRESVFPLRPSNAFSLLQMRPKSSDQQFGLKVDTSGGDVDWSVSYFSGFNRTPDLKILGITNQLDLGLDYGRVQVYGVDFATTAGEWGYRGELAYTQTQDVNGDNPLQQNSNLFVVLGLEKNLFDNFNLNTQLMYKAVDNYIDPETLTDVNTRNLAITLARSSNQLKAQQTGITLRPSYKMMNETLEIELAMVAWTGAQDALLRPKLTYAWNDHLKVIAGAELYSGPETSLFGQLKDTSSAFSEFRWYF